MAERTAHLVDHVFPDVPVRQWVLSLPYRLRYRLAWDHDLCRAVVAVSMRAVLGWLRSRARLDVTGLLITPTITSAQRPQRIPWDVIISNGAKRFVVLKDFNFEAVLDQETSPRLGEGAIS